jgi:hypothetical protein
MAHPRIEALSREFEARPPFTADGRQFRMFFAAVHEPTLPAELHYVVRFGARNEAESFQGELGLGRDSFGRDDIHALTPSETRTLSPSRAWTIVAFDVGARLKISTGTFA